MKVVSYLATLPAKMLNGQHNTSEKFLTLKNYAGGVHHYHNNQSSTINCQPSVIDH
jgi:hypothetical protein